MKSFIAILASFALSTQLWAHGGHDHDQPAQPTPAKPEVCSTQVQDLCAHIHFLTDLNSDNEVQFITHISTPNNEVIASANIDLWMDMGHGHGHGSAPVVVTPVADKANHFQVSNAYFIMMGQWLVRVKFVYNQQNVELDIPVNVMK